MSGLSLGDRIQLKLIGGDRDKVLLELDSFRDQKPGQRVRVLLRGGRAIEGVVNTASTAHLSLLAIPGDELHQIPAADLRRIQAAGSPGGVVAATAGIIGLCGALALVAVATTHSVLLGTGAAGVSIALGTAGVRRAMGRRRHWFTIWESPPELPPAA